MPISTETETEATNPVPAPVPVSVPVPTPIPVPVPVPEPMPHNWTSIKRETPHVVRVAWPVIGYYLLQQLPAFVNVMFMGRLGREELAGAALGFMFCNVTGFSVIWGITTGLDTLCTQAYGAKAFKRVGLLAQRGFLILLLIGLVIAALWFNADLILRAAGQSPKVVSLATLYVRILASSLPAVASFAAMQKYLQAQHILRPVLYVGLIANSLNVVFNYLLINVAGLGFVGAPISVSITYWLFAGLTFAYIRVRKLYRLTWPTHLTIACLEDWSHLAVPGMFMICLEWWAYELAMLLAGSIGELELASYSIIMQIWALTFMVPLGMSVAVSIRVGTHLGSGSPGTAKDSTVSAFMVTGVWLVFSTTLVLALRTSVARLFTDDHPKAVGVVVAEAMYYVAASQVLDSLQALSSGVLRGAGRQLTGAIVNFVGFYVVGLPASVIFVLVSKLGVIGCVAGLMVGLGMQVILLGSVLLRQDWMHASVLARKRALSSGTGAGAADSIASADVVGDQKGTFAVLEPLEPASGEKHDSESESTSASASTSESHLSRQSRKALVRRRGAVLGACVAVFLAGLIGMVS